MQQREEMMRREDGPRAEPSETPISPLKTKNNEQDMK